MEGLSVDGDKDDQEKEEEEEESDFGNRQQQGMEKGVDLQLLGGINGWSS